MTFSNRYLAGEIKLPKYFKDLLYSSDGAILPEELMSLELAIWLVNRIVEKTPPPPLLSLGVCFIERDSVTFDFDDETILACVCQMIIIPVGRWRKWKLTPANMVFIMVEELCHAVWRIPDGPEIEKKVTEVFATIDPSFSYAQVCAWLLEKTSKGLSESKNTTES